MTLPGHLAVIDMQHVFADADSPWAAPRFPEIVAPVAALVAAAPSTTFTRFVAPDHPTGAWVPYYEQWPFALVKPTDRLYELVDGIGATDTSDTIAATTFSKWGPGLQARVGAGALVLAGVATDCCVISTALAAADAGVPVIVVPDACAGSDDDNHERALSIMELYAPLISVVPSLELLEAA